MNYKINKRVNATGQITLPLVFRKEILLHSNDEVELYGKNGAIHIVPVTSRDKHVCKPLGTIQNLTSQCRVYIPKMYRDVLNVQHKDEFEITLENGEIVIRKAKVDIDIVHLDGELIPLETAAMLINQRLERKRKEETA